MKQLRWGLIECGDIAQKRVAPALYDLDLPLDAGLMR